MPRYKDDNGYLHVKGSHLTKAGVFAYRGAQIPETDGAPDIYPGRVYNGYRSAAELEKAAKTFDGVPLLIEHDVDSAEAPLKSTRIGSVGTGCVWTAPYIDGDLTVTDSRAIDLIESSKAKELSAGYRYTPVWQSGEVDGEHYDFLITDIRANHIAIVPRGRSGRDVVVADSADIEEESGNMDGEILEALKALTEKVDALEAWLKAEKPAEKPTIDEAVPEEAEAEAKKEAETPVEPVDKEKIAQDAEDRAVSRMKGMMKAAADVAPIYGRVDIFAFDSAEGIYGAALKANGIAVDGIDKSAYGAMVALMKRSGEPKQQRRVAMDAVDDLADVMAALDTIKRG